MSEATTPANTTDQVAATTAYDWGYDDSDGTDETCFVLGRKTDRGFEILAQVYGNGGKHLAAYIESLEAEVKRSHDAVLALTGRVERLEAERDALLAEMESFVAWADSYPKSVWHEPNAAALKAAHDALKAAGLDGIDALSAMLYCIATRSGISDNAPVPRS